MNDFTGIIRRRILLFFEADTGKVTEEVYS